MRELGFYRSVKSSKAMSNSTDERGTMLCSRIFGNYAHSYSDSDEEWQATLVHCTHLFLCLPEKYRPCSPFHQGSSVAIDAATVGKCLCFRTRSSVIGATPRRHRGGDWRYPICADKARLCVANTLRRDTENRRLVKPNVVFPAGRSNELARTLVWHWIIGG